MSMAGPMVSSAWATLPSGPGLRPSSTASNTSTQKSMARAASRHTSLGITTDELSGTPFPPTPRNPLSLAPAERTVGCSVLATGPELGAHLPLDPAGQRPPVDLEKARHRGPVPLDQSPQRPRLGLDDHVIPVSYDFSAYRQGPGRVAVTAPGSNIERHGRDHSDPSLPTIRRTEPAMHHSGGQPAFTPRRPGDKAPKRVGAHPIGDARPQTGDGRRGEGRVAVGMAGHELVGGQPSPTAVPHQLQRQPDHLGSRPAAQ